MGDDYKLKSWGVRLPTMTLFIASLRVASSFLKSPKQFCQDVKGAVKDALSLCWFQAPPAMTLRESSWGPGGPKAQLTVSISSQEIPLQAKGKLWKDYPQKPKPPDPSRTNHKATWPRTFHPRHRAPTRHKGQPLLGKRVKKGIPSQGS